MASRIIFTAFKGNTNSSFLFLDKVLCDNKVVLVNSYKSCGKQIISAINEYEPDYIIATGQKPSANKIHIETKAKGIEILETNFDLDLLINRFNEYKVDYEVSNNAGYYLCNHVYYTSLDYIKERNLKTKIIFIHVPSKKNFLQFDKVCFCLNSLVKDLSVEDSF